MDCLLGLSISTCWHFTAGYGFRALIGSKIENSKQSIRKENLIDWELALTSTLHSAICVLFAILIMINVGNDKINGLSIWAEISVLHSIGFFIYDA